MESIELYKFRLWMNPDPNFFYRNGVDPFIVNGSGAGMKGSSSETFLTRVADPPPQMAPPRTQEDFDLANGLNDLSNVVRHFHLLFYLFYRYFMLTKFL